MLSIGEEFLKWSGKQRSFLMSRFLPDEIRGGKTPNWPAVVGSEMSLTQWPLSTPHEKQPGEITLISNTISTDDHLHSAHRVS